MYCIRCGTQAPETDAYCVRCGAPLRAEAALSAGGGPAAPATGEAEAPAATPPHEPLADAPAPAAMAAAPGPVASAMAPLARAAFAGFWRRFGSLVVDFVVLYPFLAAFEIAMGGHPFDLRSTERGGPLVLPVNVVLTWLYSALLESSRRQGTLGQQVLGIRVTDLEGRRVSFGRATGRHFAQFVSGLTLGIGYLMIALTDRRQALHDKIAGCLLARGAPVTT